MRKTCPFCLSEINIDAGGAGVDSASPWVFLRCHRCGERSHLKTERLPSLASQIPSLKSLRVPTDSVLYSAVGAHGASPTPSGPLVPLLNVPPESAVSSRAAWILSALFSLGVGAWLIHQSPVDHAPVANAEVPADVLPQSQAAPARILAATHPIGSAHP